MIKTSATCRITGPSRRPVSEHERTYRSGACHEKTHPLPRPHTCVTGAQAAPQVAHFEAPPPHKLQSVQRCHSTTSAVQPTAQTHCLWPCTQEDAVMRRYILLRKLRAVWAAWALRTGASNAAHIRRVATGPQRHTHLHRATGELASGGHSGPAGGTVGAALWHVRSSFGVCVSGHHV